MRQKPTNQRRMVERRIQALHRQQNRRLRRHEQLPTSRAKIRRQARQHWRQLPDEVKREHVQQLERKGMTDPDSVALMALVGAD